MSSEEFYLTLRNMELSLDQFLLDNGIFLDGTTRVFLANMRDVTSVMAERLSEEMRDRAPKSP